MYFSAKIADLGAAFSLCDYTVTSSLWCLSASNQRLFCFFWNKTIFYNALLLKVNIILSSIIAQSLRCIEKMYAIVDYIYILYIIQDYK